MKMGKNILSFGNIENEKETNFTTIGVPLF